MSDLLAARSQMAMSLGFHIVFAAMGIAMPLLMAVAEWRWLRTADSRFLTLAQRWSKGTAILFAVGAVSGTVLSFELGLLWPSFMEQAGPVVGPLFALEGFAFFAEAIFLGLYLYGWTRLSAQRHFQAGLIVAASGILSAVFVVTANAWMNAPTGFEVDHGRLVRIDPWAPFLHPVAWHQVLHMVLAALAATGFLVAGIHAVLLLRHPGSFFHRQALSAALIVGAVPALVQPVSGDLIAKSVAQYQPAKLAAMEALFRTESGAPFVIGGLPDESTEQVPYGIQIPNLLSLLLYGDVHAEVMGLDAVPPQDRPPVAVVHVAFQVMVGCGLIMAGLAAWAGWRWWIGRPLDSDRPLLWALALASPLGFIAIEAGWVVTEVGRQPWIVDHVIRTADAVTPMPGLWVPMMTFTLLYGVLAAVVVWAMWRHIAATEQSVPRLAKELAA